MHHELMSYVRGNDNQALTGYPATTPTTAADDAAITVRLPRQQQQRKSQLGRNQVLLLLLLTPNELLVYGPVWERMHRPARLLVIVHYRLRALGV